MRQGVRPSACASRTGSTREAPVGSTTSTSTATRRPPKSAFDRLIYQDWEADKAQQARTMGDIREGR